MTASSKRRLIITGTLVVIAVIMLLTTFNRSQNKYCVQHIEPLEQGEISSQPSAMICFNNLAEQASYITSGELQLAPNVSEDEYRIAIHEYYTQLKDNR